MRRIPIGRAARASGCAVLALMSVVACNRGGEARQTAGDTASTASLDTQLPARKPPALPKVPFNQQPCQSLSMADMTALKFFMPVRTVPYKETSDSLTYDNACRWYNGGSELALIAYQTQEDYDGTSQTMKSTEHIAPSDIPGAFYDKQGYLWFAKDGYYVEIGQTRSREDVARRLLSKI